VKEDLTNHPCLRLRTGAIEGICVDELNFILDGCGAGPKGTQWTSYFAAHTAWNPRMTGSL
jgi:hypothetical protein